MSSILLFRYSDYAAHSSDCYRLPSHTHDMFEEANVTDRNTVDV
jgi:hypothetical protein